MHGLAVLLYQYKLFLAIFREDGHLFDCPTFLGVPIIALKSCDMFPGRDTDGLEGSSSPNIFAGRFLQLPGESDCLSLECFVGLWLQKQKDKTVMKDQTLEKYVTCSLC